MDANKLEALGGFVGEIDAEGPASPEEAAAAQAEQQAAQSLEDGARQWGALAFMVGGALSMAAPALKNVYTEEACLNWGRAMQPVAEKYGWNGGATPEVGLLIATAGFAFPTYFAVRQAVAEKKAGWFGGLVEWWRSRKGRKASQQVQDAAQMAGEGVGGGG